eukprot:scaffold6485_cov172-Amphora_coffeaeformis.AAC.2
MAAEKSAQKRSTTGLSGISMILWSVVCIGVGAIGGFAVFFMVYQKECSVLVQSSREGALEYARSEMRRDLDECQFHTQAMKSQMKSAKQRSEETLESIKAQHAQNVAALQEELRQQAAESSRRIAELEQERDARDDNAELTQQFQALQSTLQQRYLEETKLRYGGKNILVELSLDLGNDEALHRVVVSLERLDVLPMTTALFLFLVEADLYAGAQLTTSADDVLHGLVVATDRTRWQAQGIDPHTPLLWALEASAQQAPCPEYGFGIDWEMAQGGDFFITLGTATSKNRPCLGRVVTGTEYLTSHTKGTMTVAKVRPASLDTYMEEL